MGISIVEPQLRVSYSFLTMWSRGQIDASLRLYFHVPGPEIKTYTEGRIWDEKVTEYVKINSKLPPEFGSDTLGDPKPQCKLEVEYSPLFKAVGVLDILDGKTIYEIKTGNKSAPSYAKGNQVAFYFLICDLLGIEIEKGIIIRYNQHTTNRDRALILNTSREREKARNLIDTVAPEAYSFFTEHGLFSKDNPLIDKIVQNRL